MVLTKLISQKKNSLFVKKCHLKRDKIYLNLIELYQQNNQESMSRDVIQLVEQRLEGITDTQEYAYRLINELAIILHKNINPE